MPRLSDRIDKIYGRDEVAPYNSRHGSAAIASPEALVGLELEIEGWQWGRKHPGFRFTEDGSLRNNGIEAVTEPVRLMHAPGLLNSFFKQFPCTDANYSERCSTHVHLNVNDMTVEQVTTLCLLYQIMERLLFGFVGGNRDKNIFCVPWYQSGLTYNIVNKLSRDCNFTFARWQKYSALNLIPITTQGTVEFRHMYGTHNVELMTNWLTLIGRIREYAVAVPLEKVQQIVMDMNTVSNYSTWLEEVFQQDVRLLNGMDDHKALLSKGIVDAKLMLMGEPTKGTNDEDWAAAHTARVRRALRPAPEAAGQAVEAQPQVTFGWGNEIAEMLQADIQVPDAPRQENARIGDTRRDPGRGPIWSRVLNTAVWPSQMYAGNVRGWVEDTGYVWTSRNDAWIRVRERAAVARGV